jgi:AcrR family transcriptional regulator
MSEDETYQRIIDAAARIFAEKGFSGATTRTIAAAANVNEVTLFRHFGNKKKLYEEMVRQNSALPGLAAAIETQMSGDLHHDLQLLAKQFLGLMLKRRQEILSSLCEAERQPELRPLIGVIPQQQRLILSDYLRMQMIRGSLREIDAEMAAQALLGSLLAYSISQSLLPKEMTERPIEEVAALFVQLFIEGIKT